MDNGRQGCRNTERGQDVTARDLQEHSIIRLKGYRGHKMGQGQAYNVSESPGGRDVERQRDRFLVLRRCAFLVWGYRCGAGCFELLLPGQPPGVPGSSVRLFSVSPARPTPFARITHFARTARSKRRTRTARPCTPHTPHTNTHRTPHPTRRPDPPCPPSAPTCLDAGQHVLIVQKRFVHAHRHARSTRPNRPTGVAIMSVQPARPTPRATHHTHTAHRHARPTRPARTARTARAARPESPAGQ